MSAQNEAVLKLLNVLKGIAGLLDWNKGRERREERRV